MFVNLLGACTEHAVVDLGKQIHAFILRIGIETGEKVVTALVDMYSKCGNIKCAERVFRRLTIRDIAI